MTTLKQAANIIRHGGIVAFPTETIYGLGANALDERAIGKIFVAKGRPSDNPLIVHVSNEKMLHGVVRTYPRTAQRLARAFWPGPLTIVLPKRSEVPNDVTAGLATVAVRMPAHPVALALIRAARVPIAAPSANKSGRPSPTTADHVRHDLPRVPLIDGGPCVHGLESTVVDLTGKTPRILRQGAITLEELRKILPKIRVARSTTKRPASPGMKYRHYSPDKPVCLFADLSAMARYARTHPRSVALCLDKYQDQFPIKQRIMLGSDLRAMAHNIYDALRTSRGNELLVHTVPRRGHGRAIMDRLERAALHK